MLVEKRKHSRVNKMITIHLQETFSIRDVDPSTDADVISVSSDQRDEQTDRLMFLSPDSCRSDV